MGPGRGRHEGRPGGAARPGHLLSGAGGRRDLVLLRVRGGRAAATAWSSCWKPAPSCSPPTRPCWASRPAAWSRRGARGPSGSGSGLRGRRAHTARPGTGATPSTVWRRARLRWRATGPRAWSSTGASTPSSSRRSASTGAWPPTSCPTGPRLLLNFRFAPDRTIADAEASTAGAVRPATPRPGTGWRWSTPPAAPHRPWTTRCWPSWSRSRVTAPGQAGVDRRGHLSPIGVPAANFGPGDPLLAHTPDEHVARRASSRRVSATLELLLRTGP